MVNYTDAGKESEWNEASLKARRLHEIQELINCFKLNPMGMTAGKFNYEWLLMNVTILYGEGRSKYSPKEKTEVDGIKKTCEISLEKCPPHTPVIKQSYSHRHMSYTFNYDSYVRFVNVLEYYENKVKDLNDEHGLTTKNKGYGGMF